MLQVKKNLFKGLNAVVLHANSNRQVRLEGQRVKNDIGYITKDEKKLLQELIKKTETKAKEIMQDKIRFEKDQEEKKYLQRAIGDWKSSDYLSAVVKAYEEERDKIIDSLGTKEQEDRFWDILDNSAFVKKITQYASKLNHKNNLRAIQSEADLRRKIQQIPEIQQLRKTDDRYRTADKTKGESESDHEKFINSYIDAKPAMRDHRAFADEAIMSYFTYKHDGSTTDIINKYKNIGLEITKALSKEINLNDSNAIEEAKRKFFEKYGDQLTDQRYEMYTNMFQDLISRAEHREQTRFNIKSARKAAKDVDKQIRQAYRVKDSAKKFNTDLQEESVSLFDEDIFDDITDDQLEQYMIEMYEAAIRYGTISAMIDRMYDLEYK